MGKIKVAFFDIDGTLADNELPQRMGIYPRIPDSARAAIRKLKESGIEPVLATGRNYDILQRFTHHLGIDTVVSSNGAYVVYQGQELVSHPLERRTVQTLVNELDNLDYDFLLETPHTIYHKATSRPIANNLMQDVQVFSKYNIPSEVIQVIYYQNEKGRLPLEMPELIAEKVGPDVINIHKKTVTKATGIAEVLKQMGLSAEEAIAFGDEENDSAMFDLVKYPIAMGNASAELKKKAFYVTDTVANDGIWKACEKLGLF